MAKFVGWRYAALIGGIVGGITIMIYPISIHPYLYPEQWQHIQKETRAAIRQEDIQPGGMKVWSDPFDRKKWNINLDGLDGFFYVTPCSLSAVNRILM